ncbi:tyrosine-type recombinase/integrase [Bacillus paranthracis]|uniref:tyrosine-type recombinase/integrase n=1 Tax=Bacillus TaxID=1386 RepID=UPI00065B8608|nr:MULTISPECIES: tyrosine-type recombinase/integrase [Bacillus]ASI77619.1 hypothetical protein BA202_10350 [Bacillus cereus]ASZ18181.1 hypothetical protein CK938_17070 [Bacillus cereus]KMP79306.1 hypothetical protein TU64_27925 [Bacillus cereus]MCC2477862.1 tyrosine-type recombinase/integrase [Bacillus paranthracis]MCC2483657.1 tyrosine-type recombinase/integrase [Bacillus pacificus]
MRYKVQEDNIPSINGEGGYERVITIMIESKETGRKYPSPVTDFIKTMYEYRGKSFNYQKDVATTICIFLNFIGDKVKEEDKTFLSLRDKGLYGLKYIHGSRFITSLSVERKNRRETVEKRELILTAFYEYLIKQGIIEPEFELERKLIKGSNKQTLESPFRHPAFSTVYPPKNKKPSNTLTHLNDRLINEFLQLAKIMYPSMVLGIYMQMFGGLRRGEVVNLTIDAVHRESKSVTLDVFDRQDLLFGNVNTAHSQVKKERKQPLFYNPLFELLFEDHMKQLLKVKNRHKKALFINKEGAPMTGEVYSKWFNDIKKHFIALLKQNPSRYGDYLLLKDSSWSTHIGRGVFTNLLFTKTKLSPAQVAAARGDSTLDAVMSYVDQLTIKEELSDAINNLSLVEIYVED